MNRDRHGVSESRPVTSDAGDESLRARLERVERAYRDLVDRLHRYERERTEIRARLEQLLVRLGVDGLPEV